jgi:hypothetical protein
MLPGRDEREGAARGDRSIPGNSVAGSDRKVQRGVAKPRTHARPPRPRRRCVTRRAAFLAAYRETGSIRTAAETAEITPARHYLWFQQDPAYRRDFEALQNEVAGALQDEIVERAVKGWAMPVFYRGRQCGSIQHYSDRLLMFLLKALKPEAYR